MIFDKQIRHLPAETSSRVERPERHHNHHCQPSLGRMSEPASAALHEHQIPEGDDDVVNGHYEEEEEEEEEEGNEGDVEPGDGEVDEGEESDEYDVDFEVRKVEDSMTYSQAHTCNRRKHKLWETKTTMTRKRKSR